MAENHAADYGEVLGEQAIEITADGDRIAGDVRDDRGEALNEGSQEYQCASPRAPELVQNKAVEVPQIPIGHTKMLFTS